MKKLLTNLLITRFLKAMFDNHLIKIFKKYLHFRRNSGSVSLKIRGLEETNPIEIPAKIVLVCTKNKTFVTNAWIQFQKFRLLLVKIYLQCC